MGLTLQQPLVFSLVGDMEKSNNLVWDFHAQHPNCFLAQQSKTQKKTVLTLQRHHALLLFHCGSLYFSN